MKEQMMIEIVLSKPKMVEIPESELKSMKEVMIRI